MTRAIILPDVLIGSKRATRAKSNDATRPGSLGQRHSRSEYKHNALDDVVPFESILHPHLRVDIVIPPGDGWRAVEFIARIFEAEGIPYESAQSAPGNGKRG